MELLSEGYNTTIDWLISNYIILNPKTIVIAKRNLQTIPAILSINKITIKPKVSVLLLEATIDDKLTFEKYIKKHYRSASCQLNTIFPLKSYLSFQAKKVFIETFVESNFNYCLLV